VIPRPFRPPSCGRSLFGGFDDDVVLGVRPEDVYLEETHRALDDTKTTRFVVDVVQPMGDELVVYLRADDSDVTFGSGVGEEADEPARQADQLLMTVEPKADLSSGDNVDVVLDRAQTHLFGGATGDAIVHGLTAEEQSVVNGVGILLRSTGHSDREGGECQGS